MIEKQTVVFYKPNEYDDTTLSKTKMHRSDVKVNDISQNYFSG